MIWKARGKVIMRTLLNNIR